MRATEKFLPSIIITIMLLVTANVTVGCTTDTPMPVTTPNQTTKTMTVPAQLAAVNRVSEQPWWIQPPPPISTVQPVPVKVSVQVSGDVLFDVDRAELTPAAGSQLGGLRDLASQHPGTLVTIAGYTDSDGTEAHNQALSQRRAQGVADWLTAQGIAADRVQAHGYGAADPVQPNDNAEHKAANRRVVITVASMTGSGT